MEAINLVALAVGFGMIPALLLIMMIPMEAVTVDMHCYIECTKSDYLTQVKSMIRGNPIGDI